MPESVRSASRSLFLEIVLPLIERHFPEVASRTAFGLFGYGSEAYGYDDKLSRDHHFGLRIDGLLPDELVARFAEPVRAAVAEGLPATYHGWPLREGHLKGAGLSLDSYRSMLQRTIGLERLPQTNIEWMSIPEEEILHLTNGEVWHDPSGEFTAMRAVFSQHYPEPVRRRRIAHWCRYYSGMGTYALKRAILRNDNLYAFIAFGKAVRWGAQLAFLLERIFFPYDKWLMRGLAELPRLGAPVGEILRAATANGVSWERRLDHLDELASLFDAEMVAQGLIRPHPRFEGSPTSGFRLLEHAYAELVQSAPEDLKRSWPQWDQIYLEQFHSGYVDGLPLDTWDAILGLRPTE